VMMTAGFSVMTDKEAEKELHDLCRRHGIDPEKEPSFAKGNPKEFMNSIRDPAGLFHDLMVFTERKSKKEMTQVDPKGDLTDLKINGDHATGMV